MHQPVIVVDDHATLAELMQHGIDAQPDLHCVGVAHTAAQARVLAASVPFAAAVVDLGLPDGDGAELVGDLRRLAPAARVVVLTAHPRTDLARRALAAGASAVLAKRGSFGEVLDALRGGAATVPTDGEDPLTSRERDVLGLLAQGLDVRAIAARRKLSEHTVRDHVRAILRKLDAHSQVEALVTATRAGLVALEPR